MTSEHVPITFFASCNCFTVSLSSAFSLFTSPCKNSISLSCCFLRSRSTLKFNSLGSASDKALAIRRTSAVWEVYSPIFENTLLKKLCSECENAFTHCFLKNGEKFSFSSGFLMYGIADNHKHTRFSLSCQHWQLGVTYHTTPSTPDRYRAHSHINQRIPTERL